MLEPTVTSKEIYKHLAKCIIPYQLLSSLYVKYAATQDKLVIYLYDVLRMDSTYFKQLTSRFEYFTLQYKDYLISTDTFIHKSKISNKNGTRDYTLTIQLRNDMDLASFYVWLLIDKGMPQ